MTDSSPDAAEKTAEPANADATSAKARFIVPRVLVFLLAIGAAAFLGWRYDDFALASVAGWLGVTMLPMRALFRVVVVLIFLMVTASFVAVVAVEDDTDYVLGTRDTLVVEKGPVLAGLSISLRAEGLNVTESRVLPGLRTRHTTGPWDLRLHLLDHSRSAETVTVVSAKVNVNGTDVWLYGGGIGGESDAVALDPTRQAAFGSPMVGTRVVKEAAPVADAYLGTFAMPEGATGQSMALVVELALTGGTNRGEPVTYQFTIAPASVGDSGFLVKKAE